MKTYTVEIAPEKKREELLVTINEETSRPALEVLTETIKEIAEIDKRFAAIDDQILAYKEDEQAKKDELVELKVNIEAGLPKIISK